MKQKVEIVADILAVVGFLLACFTACHVFPNREAIEFDYQAVLVGIIAAVFTLLVGWNIYQMVDWKNKEQKVAELQDELKQNINYMHNKTDYNQALVYAMMSQSASSVFAPNQDNILKYQMLSKSILAMKIFSKFPDCQNEIQSLIKTTIAGLQNSASVTLSDDMRTGLLVSCGEIENRDNIKFFPEFIQLLKQA